MAIHQSSEAGQPINSAATSKQGKQSQAFKQRKKTSMKDLHEHQASTVHHSNQAAGSKGHAQGHHHANKQTSIVKMQTIPYAHSQVVKGLYRHGGTINITRKKVKGHGDENVQRKAEQLIKSDASSQFNLILPQINYTDPTHL